MKVIRGLAAAGILAFTFALAGGASAAGPIQVMVNGQQVNFPDQQPVMVDNRVLVPLRGVFEQLGASVDWNPANQAITAVRGGVRVNLAINSRDASVNGSPVSLDVPAQLMGGRTMVPLRFVSESIGARVGWDDATQTVTIRMRGTGNGNPNFEGSGRQQGQFTGLEVLAVRPGIGATIFAQRPAIYVSFRRAAYGNGSVHLWLNGKEVTNDATITDNSISYTPPFALGYGVQRARIVISDGQGHTAQRQWTFTTAQ